MAAGTLVGSTSSIQGNVTNQSVLEFNQTEDGAFSHDIGGDGLLVKSGSGTLSLTGSNEGLNTLITDGTLLANSQQSIGSTGGTITVGAESTFAAGADIVVSQQLVTSGPSTIIDTGAHTVTLAGGGSGDACLIKVGSGRLNVASYLSNPIGACVNEGIMSFNDRFDGDVSVNPDARIGGSGVINGNVAVNGVLAPGNSPGVLTISGSVTQGANSTLALDIDGPTAGNGAGFHDALVLIGSDSVYTAGGVIAPSLRDITGDATNSYTASLGQTFEVVIAEGGVVGSFEGIEQPVEGLPDNTRFDVIYGDTSLFLVVTPDQYALMGTTTNAAAAGGALDVIRPEAGIRQNASNTLIEQLSGLDAAGADLALEQLSGSIHASLLDATLQSSRSARATLLQTLMLGNGADGELKLQRGIWGNIGAQNGRVDADRSGRGYDFDSRNYQIGFDFVPGDHWLVGFSGAYIESTANKRDLGIGKVESYRGGIHALWSSGSSYVAAQADFSTESYKINRQVAFTANAVSLSSESDGDSYGFDVEAGHRFAVGAVGITPVVGLSHDRISRYALTEAGETSPALTFDESHRTAWNARSGVRLDSGSSIFGGSIQGYLSGTVMQELGDSHATLNPSLQATRFRVNAADIGDTAFLGEAGVTGTVSQMIDVQLGYRFQSSGNANANSLSGTVRLRF